MTDFQALRTFLEQRRALFAQAVEDPGQFEREFTNLENSWQNIHSQAVLQEMTERAMRKYPSVWQALEAAGLIQQDQEMETNEVQAPASPILGVSMVSLDKENSQRPLTESQIIPEAESLLYSRSTSEQSQRRKTETVGDNTMHDEQHTSQSTSDRLAIWDKKIVTGKEIVTGIMGIMIVVITLIIAIITIFSVSNAETFAAAKDVLLFLNGLVGVVLGYYFGRVPGEVRAEKAESDAREARSDLDRTAGEVRGILDEGEISTDRSGGNGEITLAPAQVEHLRRLLRQH